MDIFIINRTDNFHSLNSFDLLGIATTFKKALKIVKAQAKEENIKLSKYDKKLLKEIGQTQSSDFEGEFNIRNHKTNILL